MPAFEPLTFGTGFFAQCPYTVTVQVLSVLGTGSVDETVVVGRSGIIFIAAETTSSKQSNAVFVLFAFFFVGGLLLIAGMQPTLSLGVCFVLTMISAD
jgi:hypothetical protein